MVLFRSQYLRLIMLIMPQAEAEYKREDKHLAKPKDTEERVAKGEDTEHHVDGREDWVILNVMKINQIQEWCRLR